MNLTKLIEKVFSIVPILADQSTTGPEKLNQLTDQFTEMGEIADDAVEMLPWGIAQLAKLGVDNPISDNWQRVYLWKPIAEGVYQVWSVLSGAFEKLSDFAKNIVRPVINLIGELAETSDPNSTKRQKLEDKIFSSLTAVEDLTTLLPGGFGDFVKVLLKGDLIQDFKRKIAAFVGEVLYQVWKALHPHQVSGPTILPA